MIVLTTTSQQTLKIVPREYLGAVLINVTDTSLNKQYNYLEDTVITSGNYATFNNNYIDASGNSIFKEDRFYDLLIYADYNYWNMNLSTWQEYDEIWSTDSTQRSEMYGDKIFVTNQDIDQLNDNDHYDINNGQYTTNNSYNNEYIVV